MKCPAIIARTLQILINILSGYNTNVIHPIQKVKCPVLIARKLPFLKSVVAGSQSKVTSLIMVVASPNIKDIFFLINVVYSHNSKDTSLPSGNSPANSSSHLLTKVIDLKLAYLLNGIYHKVCNYVKVGTLFCYLKRLNLPCKSPKNLH